MSDYNENEVRCKLTKLKYAIDSEQQDHERERIEMTEKIVKLQDMVGGLQVSCAIRDEKIDELYRVSKINREALVFMICVAACVAGWAVGKAVWC